ncbi:MAG: dephospho-CoA kinase [Candidatus Woesearchaeota archaeon]
MRKTKEILEEENTNSFLLGVTGSIGCGKTHVCHTLIDIASNQGLSLSYVNLDTIRRQILGTESRYAHLRLQLSDHFGERITKLDGSIDGKELGQIIFYDSDAMNYFRNLISPAIDQELEIETQDKKGLVLVEWALLVEDGLLPLVKGDVLVTTCSYDKQIARLMGGDLPLNQILKRRSNQLTNSEKIEKIRAYQQDTGGGKLYVFDTTENPSKGQYRALLEKIIQGVK